MKKRKGKDGRETERKEKKEKKTEEKKILYSKVFLKFDLRSRKLIRTLLIIK